MVANTARGQLNRKNRYFSCPRSRLRIWSRERDRLVRSPHPASACSSRYLISLSHLISSHLILYTQPAYDAYSRDFSRFPRRRPHILSTPIGPVPMFSGHVIAYRWRSLPRAHWHRASASQGSSSNGCCLFRFHHGPFFYAPLFSNQLLVCSRCV